MEKHKQEMINDLPVELLLKIFLSIPSKSYHNLGDRFGLLRCVHPWWRDTIDTLIHHNKSRKTMIHVLLESVSLCELGLDQDVKVNTKSMIQAIKSNPQNQLFHLLFFPMNQNCESHPLCCPMTTSVLNYCAIYERIDLIERWLNQPYQSFFIKSKLTKEMIQFAHVVFYESPDSTFEWFCKNYRQFFPSVADESNFVDYIKGNNVSIVNQLIPQYIIRTIKRFPPLLQKIGETSGFVFSNDQFMDLFSSINGYDILGNWCFNRFFDRHFFDFDTDRSIASPLFHSIQSKDLDLFKKELDQFLYQTLPNFGIDRTNGVKAYDFYEHLIGAGWNEAFDYLNQIFPFLNHWSPYKSSISLANGAKSESSMVRFLLKLLKMTINHPSNGEKIERVLIQSVLDTRNIDFVCAFLSSLIIFDQLHQHFIDHAETIGSYYIKLRYQDTVRLLFVNRWKELGSKLMHLFIPFAGVPIFVCLFDRFVNHLLTSNYSFRNEWMIDPHDSNLNNGCDSLFALFAEILMHYFFHNAEFLVHHQNSGKDDYHQFWINFVKSFSWDFHSCCDRYPIICQSESDELKSAMDQLSLTFDSSMIDGIKQRDSSIHQIRKELPGINTIDCFTVSILDRLYNNDSIGFKLASDTVFRNICTYHRNNPKEAINCLYWLNDHQFYPSTKMTAKLLFKFLHQSNRLDLLPKFINDAKLFTNFYPIKYIKSFSEMQILIQSNMFENSFLYLF